MEEKQEKEKELLDVRRLMEEQRKESKNEVTALLAKQVQAFEEATKKLKSSHQHETEDLMEKHQQEVEFTQGTVFEHFVSVDPFAHCVLLVIACVYF